MPREISLYFSPLSRSNAISLIMSGIKELIWGHSSEHLFRSKLENQWINKFQAEDAIVFPSGRSGIYSLLKSIGVGNGDEVIITGFTCIAVPAAILHAKAIPVYADITQETYGMSPDSVEKLISPRTKAIMLQHTFGMSGDLDRLLQLARNNNITVIEDACLATGAKYNGRILGTFGDASVFSFELSKTLTAGWGGLVQVNSKSLSPSLRKEQKKLTLLPRFTRAKRLIQTGLCYWLYNPNFLPLLKYLTYVMYRTKLFDKSGSGEETTNKLGKKVLANPSDRTWNVISEQLSRLDQITDAARRNSTKYIDTLEKVGWYSGTPSRKDAEAGLIRFPLLVKTPSKFVEFFYLRGIEIGRWFTAPVHPMPKNTSKYYYDSKSCPVSEKISLHIINLPIHQRLSYDDVEMICNTIEKYASSYPDELVKYPI